MSALATEGATKRFGETTAVDGVSLELEPGEVHGLLGPNGAGKTTLLRMLLGLVRPDAGTILLHGRGLDDPRRLEGVAGFVEEPGFYPYLSGLANLAVLAELDGGGRDGEAARLLERVGLGGRGGDRLAGYSTGMRKRLGLAAALLRAPRLLLLDEPTTGLDPQGVRLVAELVRSLADEGTAVLLSSHQIAEVQDVCDGFTVLRRGRTVWSGSAAQMRAHAPPASTLLETADDARAREIAATVPGVALSASRDGAIVAAAGPHELDALVLALGAAGVAVRRLEPLEGPLESLFSSLVGDGQPGETAAGSGS